MAIPKIIHQVWEGRTEPKMPTCLKILARTWREQNPSWEYHLWNGDEMDDLVKTHFPEYLSMYKSFPYNVQRWDSIRYMILHVYGGVYTDLDTECFQPIDELFEGKSMCIGEEPPAHNIYSGINHLIGNALMASDIKNEGWLNILEEIRKTVKKEYDPKEAVLYTTGPFMISNIYPELVKSGKADVLSYQEVTPVTMLEMRRYILYNMRDIFNEKIENAYCAHYFFGTWASQCFVE